MPQYLRLKLEIIKILIFYTSNFLCTFRVLKSSVDAMVRVSTDKNLVGSALAGALGGFNAHAANVVAAAFIACGQDAAHVVSSAQCLTLLEPYESSESDPALYMSCTMPCLEVGSVGGGTALPAQRAALSLLGFDTRSSVGLGTDEAGPGSGAGAGTGAEPACGGRLARVLCAAVLASELSLLAALSAGHLVGAHARLNRARTAQVQLAASAAAGATAPPAFQT